MSKSRMKGTYPKCSILTFMKSWPNLIIKSFYARQNRSECSLSCLDVIHS